LSEAFAGTFCPETSIWYVPSMSSEYTKPMPTMQESVAL